jgi:hypothetical protein
MQDLVGGYIDLMFDQPPNSLPHVRDGSINAYAVTANDVLLLRQTFRPWTREDCRNSMFLFGPVCGRPRGRRKRLSQTQLGRCRRLGKRVVQRRLTDLGQEVPARDQQSAAALAALQAAEIQRWWPIVREMNLQAK